MKKPIIAFAALAALSIPSLADPGNGNGFGQGDGGGRDHKMSGAPGPLVGAAFPSSQLGTATTGLCVATGASRTLHKSTFRSCRSENKGGARLLDAPFRIASAELSREQKPGEAWST